MAIKQTQARPNYLGIKSWVWPRGYKLERYLYSLHRVTGLWLLFFVLVHLISIGIFQIRGENVFASTIIMFQNQWWRTLAFVTLAALSYHALDGVRLILQQLGFALGKPSPPIFPYRDELRRHRPVMFVILVIAAIFTFALLADFFAGGW